MTMTPGEVERKVRQLDHDVQAVYVMLADIGATQGRHTNRLNELQAMVGTLDERLTGRLDAHDARFDAVDARFAAVDAGFDAVDARFDRIDERFDGLTQTMAEVLRRLPG